MLGWLWQGYDAAYRWFHGVEDLPAEGEVLLRIGVERYRGRPVALRDGSVVTAGDLIGTIHFNNEVVAAIHDRAAHPAGAGILLLRAVKRSLETLARLGESHPRYRAVKAFRATTILHQGSQRAGFDVFPLRFPLWGRIVGAYERYLLGRFHPLGRERGSREKFREVRAIWISSREIRRRYGSAKSSPSEPGASASL